MALRITTELVKFKNLIKDLDIPIYRGIGLLEAIWHFTAKNAIQGDIGRHTNQEIAEWIGWEGDADKMIDALTKRRWLDTHSVHRLIVHDWHEHADKSTKTILKNRKLSFVEAEIVTTIPKEIIGIPEVQIGSPPESREQSAGAESGVLVQSAGAEGAGFLEKPSAVFQDVPKALSDARFHSEWLLWEKYLRQTHGRPMQPMSRGPAWAKLLERAPPGKEVEFAISTIRQAMANGWKGLYPQEERKHVSGNKRAFDTAPGGGRVEHLEAPTL